MSQKPSLAKQCLHLNIITIDKYSTYVDCLSRDISFSPLTRVNIINISKDNLINYFLKIDLKKRLLQYLKYYQYFNRLIVVPKSQKSDA